LKLNTTPLRACLGDAEFDAYVSGSLPSAEATALEEHLAYCDNCRHSLAELMRILAPVMTPEEAREEAALVDAVADRVSWPPPRRSSTMRRWAPAVGLAAALLVGAAVLWTPSEEKPPSAEAVVELLLAQNRPFEARLSGQTYLPMKRTRDSQPAQDALIVDALTDPRPEDLGRVLLITGEFDRSIEQLRPAAVNGPAPAVLNDLGVAYLERGLDGDLDRAVDAFTRAIGLDAAFASAQFNLVLAYDRAGLAAQAQDARDAYFRLDSDSAWSRELRQKGVPPKP